MEGGLGESGSGIDRDWPGAETGESDRDRLRTVLAEQSKATREPLWIVLIGHGTYDGREPSSTFEGRT